MHRLECSLRSLCSLRLFCLLSAARIPYDASPNNAATASRKIRVW
jgi:hypothetical protein